MNRKRKNNIYNFITVIILTAIGCFVYVELANGAEPACLSPRNTNSILCRGN